MQLGLELEPGHQPPAAPPPAPPRREARNELKPATAFRITARRTQLRRPRPDAIGDLDPDDAVPGNPTADGPWAKARNGPADPISAILVTPERVYSNS